MTMIIAARCRTLIATALFATGAFGLSVLTAEAASVEPPRVNVKYGDLNIDSPQGADVLYARIRRAARNVCGKFDADLLDVFRQREVCINKAISGAVTKVNAPALYAIYDAKTGKAVPRLVASNHPIAQR